MDYLLPLGLILLGFVNINLVRVALRVGKIQSRMLNIKRDQSPTSFWSALIFQSLVSVLCFGAAYVQLMPLIGA